MISKEAAMRVHRRLVRRGEYGAARMVLRGLRRGVVSLGLSDAGHTAEVALREAGATFTVVRRGGVIYCGIIQEAA